MIDVHHCNRCFLEGSPTHSPEPARMRFTPPECVVAGLRRNECISTWKFCILLGRPRTLWRVGR
jgi:hypothetical protein